MLCADFKVRLRLWASSFAAAKWMSDPPKDYATYLSFYQLSLKNEPVKKDQNHLAKARAGWIMLGKERIWTQAFKPSFGHADNAPTKGTLVHLHGYYDHGASYPSLQRWALKNNLHYLTADLPGHGLSSGKRASIASFDDYQRLLSSLVEVLETEDFPRPWLLSGFSTGAAIALEHQLTARCFDYTLLLAPLIRPVGWQKTLVKWLWLPQVLIKKVPRKFTVNSNDAQFLKFAKQQDCLQSRWLPLAWIRALGRWVTWIESRQPSTLEALIVQGDLDGTVDWQYNLPLLARLLPQATTQLIEGGGHQLLNDGPPQQAQVFEYLDQWLMAIYNKV